MIALIELAKLSQSQVALTAAYRGGFILQEPGWTRYPAASWNKPAIVAMAGDQCVGVLNYSEDEDDLILSIDFAFADPQHPAALTMMLARFRSKYRGGRFDSIRFTCHPGNEQMMKAVAVMGLSPVSSSYRVPIERLGRTAPSRPEAQPPRFITTSGHLPDRLIRQFKGEADVTMFRRCSIMLKRLGWGEMAAKAKRSTKIKRAAKTPEQRAAERVRTKALAIGVPAIQLDRGDYAEVDVPLRDGGRVVTLKTLVNRGGTPIARWKSAKLLSASQIAAIDHCEALWARLGGKSLVMDFDRIPGGGQGNGWSEQEALDDLRRMKEYVPMRYWSVFESVCRFDEPAGCAGSALTTCRNDQVASARVVVQFVADIIALKERLTAG